MHEYTVIIYTGYWNFMKSYHIKYVIINVTGFAKTVPNHTRNEFNLWLDLVATLIHYP